MSIQKKREALAHAIKEKAKLTTWKDLAQAYQTIERLTEELAEAVKKEGNYYTMGHILYFDSGDPDQDCLAMCKDADTAFEIAAVMNQKDKQTDEDLI